MKILLVGPQGSGKSTQAKLLSEHLKIPVISTGDIFRQLSTDQSEIAIKVKQVLAEGKLVDDQMTSEIVKERLAKEDCGNGFILDGYPRNIAQINLFDPGFDKVLYFKLGHDKSIDRLINRGREDDTKESIETRLNIYYQQTEPILEYYENKGNLIEIDAALSIEEVWEKVKSLINS